MPTFNGAELFEPFVLNGVQLRNRLVVPSMQVGKSRTGAPNTSMIDYLVERIRGGFGLIMTESCAVDHPAATDQPLALRMTAETQSAWRELITAIHAHGGRIFVQLWHEGAARKMHGESFDDPACSVSPSGLLRRSTPNGRAATTADLENLRDAYVRSAVMAMDAGADGIELHAAHGYLLDQFLWHETNIRDDEYGGAEFADRIRFPAEVVSAVRAAVGPDIPIAFRFSQWKEVDFEARVFRSPGDLELFVSVLRQAGVDLFDVSQRRFYQPEWPVSPRSLAAWVKSMTDAAVMTVGSVGLDTEFKDILFGPEGSVTAQQSIALLVDGLEAGGFDLVGVGRSSIGDPYWPEKIRSGQFDDIRAFQRSDLATDDSWDGWDPWVFREGYEADGTPRLPAAEKG